MRNFLGNLTSGYHRWQDGIILPYLKRRENNKK
jgi:hypothetical protein